MSWNAVLPILPTARNGWADFDHAGSGKPILDHPQGSLEYWITKPEKILITVLFENGTVKTKMFGYNRKDADLASSLQKELEQRLGLSTTRETKNDVTIVTWGFADVTYNLCIPDDSVRGGGIAFGATKKGKAQQYKTQ